MGAEMLYSIGIILIFIGILVILVAFMLLFLSSVRGGKIKGGGAVIIGPFPIVFGTDKESIKTVLLLSITLVILLAAITVIFYFISK